MIRVIAVSMLLATAACTIPTYEADPVSPRQWQERQERIQREQAERDRLCAITRPEGPRKEQLCRGVVGGPR
jgi:hypothetical protein